MSAPAVERIESAQPAYLTPVQVAELLQVNVRSILRWAQQDASMPATRIGRVVRFERALLLRWLARKRPRAAHGTAQETSSAA
jgi:excisionase family DNA binding protein